MDELTLADKVRENAELTNEEREYTASALEHHGMIHRLVYHTMALRAMLAVNADQMENMGRKEQAEMMRTQVADINNVFAGVSDIPEVQALLFPEAVPPVEAK